MPHDYEDAVPVRGLPHHDGPDRHTCTASSSRASPIITDVSGIFAFQPTVTYRVTDNFLLSATYLAIATTRKTGIGTFRDHDMVQLRATVQLN